MRISLIIFGVIFLVVGGLLYLVPMQQVKADTTTVGNGDTDMRTSSASVTVPVEWAYATAIIGFVLLMLGLVIPGPVKAVQGPRGPRGSRGSRTVLAVQGPRGPRGRSSVRYRRSTPRRSKGAALHRGTSVTTTTRIKR